MKPPDLQELVARHGTYDRIPAEEWRKYDAAMATYRSFIRGPSHELLQRQTRNAAKAQR